jgi:hypothetical protein
LKESEREELSDILKRLLTHHAKGAAPAMDDVSTPPATRVGRRR